MFGNCDLAATWERVLLQKDVVFPPKSKIGAADAAAGETPAPPFNYARPTRAHHARAEVVILSLLQIFFERTALMKYINFERYFNLAR